MFAAAVAGDDENARADDRTDADHDQAERPQRAVQLMLLRDDRNRAASGMCHRSYYSAAAGTSCSFQRGGCACRML